MPATYPVPAFPAKPRPKLTVPSFDIGTPQAHTPSIRCSSAKTVLEHMGSVHGNNPRLSLTLRFRLRRFWAGPLLLLEFRFGPSPSLASILAHCRLPALRQPKPASAALTLI